MIFLHRFQIGLAIASLCFQTTALAQLEKTLHLTLKDAVFLSLRYNQNVQSAELQRIVDKFALAVQKNQFEFRYTFTGNTTASIQRSNGSAWSNTRSFNLTPGITRKTRLGTEYGLSMDNSVTYDEGNARYLYNPALTFRVGQPLLRGSGQVIAEASLTHAFINEENAKLALKNTIINQISQIILDYRAIVIAENTLIVDQEALEAAEETVKQNNVRIKTGFMAPSENVQAKSTVAAQALQVVSDKNAIIQTKLNLLKNIGLAPNTHITVDSKITTAGHHYPKGKKAKQLLFENNIGYLLALNDIKNLRLSLLESEDAQRWTLDLEGTIKTGGGSSDGINSGLSSLFNTKNQSRSLNLSLGIPIDDLTAQQQLVTSKVGYDKAKLLLQQLRLSLEIELEGTLENLTILEKQIELAANAKALANQSYQDALKKLSYGKASTFEVTSLQTSLITSQIAYISNQINYLNSISNYQKNLGITLDVWNIHIIY